MLTTASLQRFTIVANLDLQIRQPMRPAGLFVGVLQTPLIKSAKSLSLGFDMESTTHIASPETLANIVLDDGKSQSLQAHDFLSDCGKSCIRNFII